MGLDMYLTKKTYVKNWEHDPKKVEVKVSGDSEKIKGIKPERVSYIEEEVAYWRKANMLHDWFVKNCQDGVDDCGTYDVSIEQLKELYELCNQVSEDHTKAKELLPCAEGFFFGSQEYGEYYFEDIKSTQEILSGLISEHGENGRGEYYYHSSW